MGTAFDDAGRAITIYVGDSTPCEMQSVGIARPLRSGQGVTAYLFGTITGQDRRNRGQKNFQIVAAASAEFQSEATRPRQSL